MRIAIALVCLLVAAAPLVAAPASPCDHPYYPVRPGTAWRYRITGAGEPVEYTVTQTGVTATTFTEHRVFPSFTQDVRWRCGAAGLQSLDYAQLVTKESQITYTTVKSSGVTIPPESQWRIGASWTATYEIEGRMSGGSGPTSQGTAAIAQTIVAQEAVTVPAGSYTAFRLDTSFTLKLTTKSGPISVPTNITSRGASWHARGVGFVKSRSTAMGTTAEVVLLRMGR